MIPEDGRGRLAKFLQFGTEIHAASVVLQVALLIRYNDSPAPDGAAYRMADLTGHAVLRATPTFAIHRRFRKFRRPAASVSP